MSEQSNVVSILSHPKNAGKEFTKNPEDVENRLISLMLGTIDDIMEFLLPLIISTLAEVGIDATDEKLEHLEDTLESIMMEHYGLPDELSLFLTEYNSFKQDLFTMITDEEEVVEEQ